MGKPVKPADRRADESTPHDRHHAEQRRRRRDAARAKRGDKSEESAGPLRLYGLHAVRHALRNPARVKHRLYATANALARLDLPDEALAGVAVEPLTPRELDRLVGEGMVHQGCVLETEPLTAKPLEALGESRLLLMLDQVTDPHNVGAVMRSAVALGAGALITTKRHSPTETGVLAKAASGAVDLIDHLQVRNLAAALETLHGAGYRSIGLDSEAGQTLETALAVESEKTVLVLGAEGRGLREKTRATCSALARIDLPGEIVSLNVSNAAALALYIARRRLGES